MAIAPANALTPTKPKMVHFMTPSPFQAAAQSRDRVRAVDFADVIDFLIEISSARRPARTTLWEKNLALRLTSRSMHFRHAGSRSPMSEVGLKPKNPT